MLTGKVSCNLASRAFGFGKGLLLLLFLASTTAAVVAQAPVISYSTPQTYTVGTAITTLTPTNTGGAVAASTQVTTFAGSGSAGFVDGTGTAASLNGCNAITIDAADNLYVTDYIDRAIRKITPAGVVTTFATSGLTSPVGVAADNAGNIFVADQGSNLILKITSAGVLSTFAGSGNAALLDGTGTAASFNTPYGLAIDAANNIYVADLHNNAIRKITPAGVVTTLAGNGSVGQADGIGAAARFTLPGQVAVDLAGNVYVSDGGNNSIRFITPAGVVTTIAGLGGPVALNAINIVGGGLKVDITGNIYFASQAGSTNANKILKIKTPSSFSIIAGTGVAGATNGLSSAATFNRPQDLVFDSKGNLFVVEQNNNLVREITFGGYSIDKTLPVGLSFNTTTGLISGTPTVASPATTYTITGYNASGSSSTTINIIVNPLTQTVNPPIISYPSSLNYVTGTTITAVPPQNTGGAATGYTINNTLPNGLSFDPATGIISGTPRAAVTATSYTITAFNAGGSSSAIITIQVIIASTVVSTPPVISYATPQTYTAGTAIAPLTPANTGGGVPLGLYGQVNTFAGVLYAYTSTDGQGQSASFGTPSGIAFDSGGNLFVSDEGTNQIRKITPAGLVTTFAGMPSRGSANGQGIAASFQNPNGLAIDAFDNIYVADQANQQIRKITSAGLVSTYAGSGAAGSLDNLSATSTFNNPIGVAVDAAGNVFVADLQNSTIRKINMAGFVTTFAGSAGTVGGTDGQGAAASFNMPYAITTDVNGNVYVGESNGNLIREINTQGLVATLAGTGQSGNANGAGRSASFNQPIGLAFDRQGNLFVADDKNNVIRKITPQGSVTTLAGTGLAGHQDGALGTATFNGLVGLAFDKSGNLFVSEGSNCLIRKITLTGYVIDKPLTAGLSFDFTTGIISGTPTTASPATNYTITAYNAYGSSTTVVSIAVNAASSPGIAPNISYTTPQTYTVNTAIAALAPANIGGAVPATIYGQVTTFAGSGVAGNTDGQGTVASFNTPYGLTVDKSANIYVADYGNQLIRKITSTGLVSTYAGNGSGSATNGPAASAAFNFPGGVATDAAGNVYVGDQSNNLIRAISTTGIVSTFAGNGAGGSANGPASSASFNGPAGLAFDGGGSLYIADRNNNLIRKITAAGVVSTFAGSGFIGSANGTGTAASFSNCTGVATDLAGNVYVTDQNNNLIRKITPAGVVSTYAGNGTQGNANGSLTTASFYRPFGLTVDYAGTVYVADEFNNLIRAISPTGSVSTLAGTGAQGATDGIGTVASFNYPSGAALDGLGNLFVNDAVGNKIRKIIVTGYTIDRTLPSGLTFDQTTGIITGMPTVASPASNYTVTAYNIYGSSTTVVNIAIEGTTTMGTAPNISYSTPQTYLINTSISALTPTNTGGAVPATIYGQVTTFAGSGAGGNVNGQGTAASFATPYGLTVDKSANIYVADYGNQLIRKITSTGLVSTYAGSGFAGAVNGLAASASFNYPGGVTTDAAGNVYVGDQSNNLIRTISTAGVVSTFAGNSSQGLANGAASSSSFNGPAGLAFDGSGNLYVADRNNNAIRKITSAGVVSTFAGSGNVGSANGTGTAASFSNCSGVATDLAGNVYVTDQNNNLIRKITPTGVVSTYAGSGGQGSTNGLAATASFYRPFGLTVDYAGTVYVADEFNNLIRAISPTASVFTLAGSGVQGATDGLGSAASFNYPSGVALDGLGNLFVNDAVGDKIRKIIVTGYTIDKTLPAGLTFDQTTGSITGTPTVISPATNYTVTAYNVYGSSATIVNIAVNAASSPGIAPNISYTTPQTYTVNTAIAALAPANTGGAVPATIYGQVTTFAGSGMTGLTNGQGTAASFSSPTRLGLDASGNLFVADRDNNLIRKITPTGLVSTFASGFNQPNGVTVDAAGNLYVADAVTNTIKLVTPAGVVSVFAGSGLQGSLNGQGIAASFYNPYSVSADATGNIFVADVANSLIRKITPSALVTTFAGNGSPSYIDGQGTAAGFHNPNCVSTDALGNVFVADPPNNRIRKITPGGLVTTYAGSGTAGTVNGPAATATFNSPIGVCSDLIGNVYVADIGDNTIRKIDALGNVTTLAGSGVLGAKDGTGILASFNQPNDVQSSPNGFLYVTDYGNSLIRKVIVTGYTIDKTLPAGLTFDPTTGIISGTPTVTSPATNYTVTAYNAYGSSITVVNITIVDESANLLPQTITFALQNGRTTCDTSFPANATSTNTTIPLTYTSNNTAVATVSSSGIIQIVGVGTTFITVSQSGNSIYATATPETQLLTVVQAASTVSITSNAQSACAGSPITFSATTTTNVSGAEYLQWQVNGVNAGPNLNNFTATNLTSSSSVQCILTVVSSCTTTVSSNIITGLPIQPFIAPSVTIATSQTIPVCPGTAITFTATPVNGGTAPAYQWQVNGVNAGTNSAAFSATTFSNNDFITCTLTNTNYPCLTAKTGNSNSLKASIIVPVNPGPAVSITESTGSSYYGVPVTFTAATANITTNTAISYQWQVNGNDAGSNSHTFTSNTLLNGDVVTCIVYISTGCIPSVTSNAIKPVILPSSAITIINTFTPNGDGINDLWAIPDLNGYPNCLVSVFTRYGAEVYQSRGYPNAWDGTYKGKSLPMGTYYYVIDLGTGTSKLSGFVTIVR